MCGDRVQGLLTVSLLVSLLSGCTAEPAVEPQPGTGTATPPAQTEAGRASVELVAESAYLTDMRLYIGYRRGSEIEYATAARRPDPAHTKTAATLLTQGETGALFREVALVKLEEASWSAGLSAGREPLPVLPARHWQAAFRSLRENLTPRDTGMGAVYDILEREEWVSWNDATGNLQWALIQDKPVGVHIESSYRFEQVLELFVPVLEDYLETAGITSREVLLNTGDAAPCSTPFVYANMDDRVLLFLTDCPDARPPLSPKGGLARMRAVTHVLVGQGRSLVERPVTSIGRLLARTGNAVIDSINRGILIPPSADHIPPPGEGDGMDLQAWERQLDGITGSPASMGRMNYLIDGVEFFPRLIDVMQNARESIDMRMYIFDDDDYAIKIADILKARSRDVHVRVLLDGLGTIGSATQESTTLPVDYRAPLSIFRYLEKDSDVKVQRIANFLLGGDHAKSIIVDGRTGFVGGMNIGREYRYDWHDMMVELEGPVVDILHEDFHKSWVHEKFLGDLQLVIRRYRPAGPEAREGDYPIRVLFTRASDSQIYRTQLEAIRNAGNHIYIENAYFTDDLILQELIKARMRGVDVRVIVPLRSDFWLMKRNNALVANALLEHGIRVYIYPGMSHLKAALYDGWVCLGSANLDRLSLRINKEINVATSQREAARELMERVFIPDMQASVELRDPYPENGLDFLLEIISDHF